MVDKIPDYSCIGGGQCFPRWLYTKHEENEKPNIFGSETVSTTDQYGYSRESALNEKVVRSFQKKLGGGYFG